MHRRIIPHSCHCSGSKHTHRFGWYRFLSSIGTKIADKAAVAALQPRIDDKAAVAAFQPLPTRPQEQGLQQVLLQQPCQSVGQFQVAGGRGECVVQAGEFHSAPIRGSA